MRVTGLCGADRIAERDPADARPALITGSRWGPVHAARAASSTSTAAAQSVPQWFEHRHRPAGGGHCPGRLGWGCRDRSRVSQARQRQRRLCAGSATAHDHAVCPMPSTSALCKRGSLSAACMCAHARTGMGTSRGRVVGSVDCSVAAREPLCTCL